MEQAFTAEYAVPILLIGLKWVMSPRRQHRWLMRDIRLTTTAHHFSSPAHFKQVC